MIGITSSKTKIHQLKSACLLGTWLCFALASARAENTNNTASTPPVVHKASALKLTSKKVIPSESRQAVDLLESIFERLRSVPQLAVSRSKQTLAYRVYNNNGNMVQGTVDPLLIKPKDLSRLSSRLRKFSDNNVIASAQSSSSVRSAPMITNSSGIWERAQMPAPANEPAQTTDSLMADKKEYAQDKVKSYAGARGALIASRNEPDNTLIASQPLIREFGGAAKDSFDSSNFQATASMSKVASAATPSYSAGASNGMLGPQQQMKMKASSAHVSSNLQTFSKKAAIASASQTQQSEDDSSIAGYEPQSDSLKNLQQTLAGKNLAKNLPRADAEARQVQKALEGARFLRPAIQNAESESNAQPMVASATPPITDSRQSPLGLDVALLPVTKFMGIPQIRLGTGEAEALAVAIQLGTVRRETIKGWNVWSITKNKGNKTSLQFFLRAGNLDAIRILDPVFWDSAHGLTVGTGLPEVKRELGEPAFIISNNGSPSAQNYVYPISQVDFQLKRNVDDEVPKIVSIFLFAVK